MEFALKEQFEGFLKTPQIFSQNALFEYPLYQTSISPLEAELYDISAPTVSVLGKRMEHFFSCYISQFTTEEVVAQNKQIIQHKNTVGELDFLLKDSLTNEISHIELIYKFYLFDPDTGTSEKEHLIGPNKRDSLNLKLERLQKRQFPLLFHPATQTLLRQLKIDPEMVAQKMCFKANVFLPKQLKEMNFSEINPLTVSGFWIKASEFTKDAYGNNLFFTPKKQYWPVDPKNNTSWFSFDEILEQVNPLLEKSYAPLLWMKSSNGRFERFFVVWW